MMRCAHSRAFTSIACISACALTALAGPLDPPPGPIASTAKPLSEVEPRTAINAANTPGDADSVFKITQPGSYYLVANVAGAAGRHGIEIAASNVTVDLNGFALIGVPGALSGVISSSASAVRVANGTVSNWPGAGIDLANATGGIVEFISAHHNTGIGVRGASYGVMRGCTSTENGNAGLVAPNGGIIEACHAYLNNNHGISMGFGAVARDCVVRQNTGSGIFASGQATITNCVSYSNSFQGIISSSESLVEGCTSVGNGAHGIVADQSAVIRGNTCTSNGFSTPTGSGIFVAAFNARIEGNNCVGNPRGICVDLSSNIIIKNTCRANQTNWVIAVGNSVGPIISASVNVTPIAGDNYSGSLGSTDPNANFTY